MPITAFHSLTMTTPDDPAYENKPSNWNQAHIITASMTGSEIVGAFSNANGLSFGLSGGAVTGSYTVPSVAGLISGINVSGGTTSNNLSALTFSDGGNVTFGLNGSVITASAPAGGGGGNVNVSAGTTSNNMSAMTFSNANGVSFGLNGSVITGSHNAITTARASNDAIGLNTALTANGVSWTVNSSGLSLNVPAFLTTAAQSGHSHGNPTLALTNLSGTTASNSAGFTLSLSAGAGGGGNYSAGMSTIGNTSGTTGMASQQLVFVGSGGVSLSQSNNGGSATMAIIGPATSSLSATGALSASSNGATISLGVGTVSAYGGSNTTQASSGTVNLNALTFAGVGGASVGISNGSVVIHGATGGGGGGGIALANSQTTYTSGTAHMIASGALTIGSTTGQSYYFSVPATSSLSAVGNLTISTNGNTISFSVGTAAAAPVQVSAGTTSNSLSQINFIDSNGVSFGLNGSSITASHNGLTTQNAQAVSGANGSYLFQTLSFSNAQGVSWNTSAGSAIVASVETSYAASNHSHGNPTLALTNLSGTTASASNGFTLSLSAAPGGGGADGGNTIIAGTRTAGSNSGVLFDNANGITFGLNAVGGTIITASHNGLTTARASNDAVGLNTALTANGVAWTVNSSGISLNVPAFLTTAALSNHSHGNPTLALTNLSGTTASNSAGLTLSLSAAAGGGVSPVASASNGSFSFTTLAFSNANNVTFGTSAGGIITASVAAPGAAVESNPFNLLGANTAGNTTATGSTIGLSGIGLTLSGTNGSRIVISAPATSSLVGALGLTVSTAGSTISVQRALYSNWEPFPAGNNSTFSSLGQNSLYLQKLRPEENYAFSNFELRMSGSFVSSTNSNVGVHTVNYGLYSLNGSTYSSIATSQMIISASINSNQSMGYTISQGAGSYTTTSAGTAIASLMTGLKNLYLPFTSTLSAGVGYAFGIHVSSATTVGTNAHRMAILNQTIQNNLTIGKIHASTILASNASFVGDFAQAVGSVTTGAMPSSIAESALTNAVSQARLYMQFD
jgi:trimeric autotransporter adhesin